MKSKKIVSAVVTASLLTLSATTALAAGGETAASQNKLVQDNKVVSASIEGAQQSNFKSCTGTVKSVEKSESEKGTKIVAIQNSQGEETHFIINENTYFINQKEIKEGVVITGYYDATRPMMMIYPPRYVIDVAVVGDMKESVKVDLFDTNLVSKDNQLKINIDKHTKVISKDNKKYSGALEDKNLVVIYDVATRSIPAQTNPIKVIVLDQDMKNGVKEDTSRKNTEMMKLIVQIVNSLKVNK